MRQNYRFTGLLPGNLMATLNNVGLTIINVPYTVATLIIDVIKKPPVNDVNIEVPFVPEVYYLD